MLNHPNILTVHEIGICNGSPYLVSELLEGQTLRAQLKYGALLGFYRYPWVSASSNHFPLGLCL